MEESFRFGAVEVRTAQRQVLVDGRPAAIGARAFDVLLMLLEHRDRVVSKDELIGKVWEGLVVEENNLQVQISALRKLLGAGAIATIPARGYRLVAPPERPSPPQAAETAGRGPASPLPRPRTPFFGRAREKRQAIAHLGDGPLLTLIGIGGSGKTRLALEVAREAQPGFPGGVAFVDLAAVGDGQDVAAMVANGLGIREIPGTPVLQLLQERFHTSRLLLVLDNCEHLLEPVATLVDALLGHNDELRVLVTSREALGLAGERLQPVGALELARAEDVAALRDGDAVKLFVDRARLVNPEFQVDERNAAALHDVCRRLDGIPLALELAAARLNVLSVDQLRARLDDRFRLLSGGRRALPRQQTLDAVVRWSYEHLNAAEQRLLQRLSVFSGGTTIEAAVFVSAADASEHEVIEQLSSLAAKSLIGLNSDGPEPRHRMLETVRLFALERLDEGGQAGVARDRHLAFFAQKADGLMNHPDPRARSSADAVLDADRDNLIAALRYGAHGGTATQAWRLARALEGCWETFGLCELEHSLTEAMLAATGPGLEGATRAMALRAAHKAALHTGRYRRVMQLAEEHLELSRALDDQDEEFSARQGIAVAALALDDASRAGRRSSRWRRCAPTGPSERGPFGTSRRKPCAPWVTSTRPRRCSGRNWTKPSSAACMAASSTGLSPWRWSRSRDRISTAPAPGPSVPSKCARTVTRGSTALRTSCSSPRPCMPRLRIGKPRRACTVRPRRTCSAPARESSPSTWRPWNPSCRRRARPSRPSRMRRLLVKAARLMIGRSCCWRRTVCPATQVALDDADATREHFVDLRQRIADHPASGRR